jgi:threonine dehydrogenase-like Zn-dependent dehydrogenase
MSTMKAARAHKRGGPEVLRYEDAPVPAVGAREVLVEVHAAAITPGELGWDETWQSADGADRTPIVPSHEFSGVIAEVGGDVSSLTPGTQVYGLIDFNHDGAAAEYVSLPQEVVVPRPVRPPMSNRPHCRWPPLPRGKRSRIVPACSPANECSSRVAQEGWVPWRCSLRRRWEQK